MPDAKSLLQQALKGVQEGRDYTVELPNGVKLTTDGTEADHLRAQELLRNLAAQGELSTAPALPSSQATSKAGLLSERIELFLKQMQTQERSATNLLDSTFTLGLFLDLVGDKDLAEVGADDLDTFLDALAHWPSNASKKAAYQGLLKNSGLTLDEVYPRRAVKGKKAKVVKGTAKGSKVAPKYANPNDPTQTWSGRGRQPTWYATALKKRGVTAESLLITGTSSASSKKTAAKKVAKKAVKKSVRGKVAKKAARKKVQG